MPQPLIATPPISLFDAANEAEKIIRATVKTLTDVLGETRFTEMAQEFKNLWGKLWNEKNPTYKKAYDVAYFLFQFQTEVAAASVVLSTSTIAAWESWNVLSTPGRSITHGILRFMIIRRVWGSKGALFVYALLFQAGRAAMK
jgi:hypothetical protein